MAPKFIFKCVDCGKCCERDVTVYLDDITNWVDRKMMHTILPHLSIQGEYVSIKLQLDKQTRDGGPICALYDPDKQECTIKENKPISCRSYPLGYNGTNYIVVDMDCPGLGHGQMTGEKLAQMRETARAKFETARQTQQLLPMLQAVFVKRFTLESQRAIEELTPQQRSELEKILGKEQTV